MVTTTLHSDDPEMTTPIQAKSSVFFFNYPRNVRACDALFLNFLPNSSPRASVVFGLSSSTPRFRCVCFSFVRVPGQRCGPWAQSAGFLRDFSLSIITVLTFEMVKK